MFPKVFLLSIFAVVHVMCEKGTVVRAKSFDPDKDARRLKAAIDYSPYGIPDTNENHIIDFLAFRSREQRNIIAATYELYYNASLFQALVDDTSGDMKYAIEALMTSPDYFYARELHLLTKRISIKSIEPLYDFNSIMEVLLSLSKTGLANTVQTYKKLYNWDLNENVTSLVSSAAYKNIMHSFFNENRETVPFMNEVSVAQDVDEIDKTRTKWWEPNSFFQWLLLNKNYAYLSKILEDYDNNTGRNIEVDITNRFAPVDAKCLIAITRFARDKADYFARRLFEAMDGIGTDEEMLTRIIVGRSEIDLGDIKKAYKRRYKSNLHDVVKGETSKKFSKLLLSLIRICNE